MRIPQKKIIGIIFFVLIVVAIIIKIGYLDRPEYVTQLPEAEKVTLIEPVSTATSFTWRYEDGAKDPDGFPYTRIFLDVTYDNQKVISEMVDEVQGSCNIVDPAEDDKDKVAGMTKIQCYAAGFGEWYKIVKGDDSYEILRKYFVEAEPDVVPPEYKYETVAEFPLLQ